jgi:hypothetical protein
MTEDWSTMPEPDTRVPIGAGTMGGSGRAQSGTRTEAGASVAWIGRPGRVPTTAFRANVEADPATPFLRSPLTTSSDVAMTELLLSPLGGTSASLPAGRLRAAGP